MNLEQYTKTIEKLFVESHYEVVDFETLISRNGWSTDQLTTLINLPAKFSQISYNDINTIGAQWFPYNVLHKYNAFRDYPYEYVKGKLGMVDLLADRQSGKYEQRTINGINYLGKRSEDNIRTLRLEELTRDHESQDIKSMLGSSNDFRYTELEIMGMIGLLRIIKPPMRFLEQVWFPAIRHANNGIVLRAMIKCWSTSIKRWPEYWTTRYNTEIQYIIETETVLGYIIEDTMQEYHLDSIKETLANKKFSYTLHFPLLKTRILDVLKELVEPVGARPMDYSIKEYFNNSNNWATPGAASGYKIYTEPTEDGEVPQKLRINKNALPLFYTLEDVLTDRREDAGVVLKAEVGKNRIAYSASTSVTLLESYIVDKYWYLFDGSTSRTNYIAYTNPERLRLAATLISTADEYGIVSADIEANDVIQNSVFNTLIYLWQFELYPPEPEDEEVILRVADAMLYNKVRIPKNIINLYDYDFEDYIYNSDKNNIYVKGSGGALSGQKFTYARNTRNNVIVSALSIDLVSNYFPGEYMDPIVGADDSIAISRTVRSTIMQFLLNTSILLTVNPAKSYISYTSGEFFRIMYIKGSRRQGYPCRIIHSVIAVNPASSQEIDIVNNLKSYWDNCSQLIRRGGDEAVLKNWLLKLAHSKRVSLPVLCAATEQGGVGIPISDEYMFSVINPGIPRYKQTYREYNYNKTWFNEIMIELRMTQVPGGVESYFGDMQTGIRDKVARTESKDKYKRAVDNWANTYFHSKTKVRPRIPERLLRSGEAVMDFWGSYNDILGTLDSAMNQINNISRQRNIYYKVLKEYQLYTDILNRGQYPKFVDKLDTLTGLGLLFISDNFKNTKSAYVTKTLLNGQLALSSPVNFSFPADMTFMYVDMGVTLLGPVTIKSPAEFTWFSDYIRFSVATGFLPYMRWACNW